MQYETSSEARRTIENKIASRKKLKTIFRRLVDVLAGLSFVAAIYLFIIHYNFIAVISLISSFILFSIREIFLQNRHTIVRIYGPMGRFRYIFEQEFRDKFLQYFNERNTDGRPIPRIVRDYIYETSKNLPPLSSFGTEVDNYDLDNTVNARILHHNFGGAVEEPSGFEVLIGDKRENVRTFSVKNSLNVSAMSYGAINYKAAESLSIGAKDVAYVNTGEGGYGPHGVAGNDVVFQIGSGKFGVGEFKELSGGEKTRVLNRDLLKQTVRENDNIKMIQLKISQGAKPGIGGHLPGDKVTEAIAEVRKVPVGKMVISPPQHYELQAKEPEDSVRKLMDFTKEIRELTGLPVGIKMCVGRMDELDLLVDAMKETGEGPDAIQLDGADGGTGAGPNLFVNYIGFGGTIETLTYLVDRLKKAGIRDRVTVSTSGRIFTPAHAAVAFAFGADYIDSARGPLLALGCIQSLKCHTNKCPTGLTTNDPWRMHGLKIPDKSERVHHFLNGFHKDMMEVTRVTGHADPRDIEPDDLRIITHKNEFATHFDPDPLGVKYPPRGEVK